MGRRIKFGDQAERMLSDRLKELDEQNVRSLPRAELDYLNFLRLCADGETSQKARYRASQLKKLDKEIEKLEVVETDEQLDVNIDLGSSD